MRGTLVVGVGMRTPSGLIPTYAGNTHRYRAGAARCGAHPHVCGEHLGDTSGENVVEGSSPRMRGTHRSSHRRRSYRGLIPTYAGNTNTLSMPGWRLRAHPHVCGEHFLSHSPGSSKLGSSPRMRGTPPTRRFGEDFTGLIPTYAGNTQVGAFTPGHLRAHPHVCGEHGTGFQPVNSITGSSPRIRGTRGLWRLTRLGVRLIPTYAGNTLVRPRSAHPARAHPHVCGEHEGMV